MAPLGSARSNAGMSLSIRRSTEADRRGAVTASGRIGRRSMSVTAPPGVTILMTYAEESA